MYRNYQRLPTSRIIELLLITHGNSAKSIYVDAFVCVCVHTHMHSCTCVLSPLESPIKSLRSICDPFPEILLCVYFFLCQIDN